MEDFTRHGTRSRPSFARDQRPFNTGLNAGQRSEFSLKVRLLIVIVPLGALFEAEDQF